jgi:NAD(P)-dependent dehydrogenase (short-subunit alcohol dehydrogenase family)
MTMERITTNFGFGSTAMEVIEGVDLSGKRAIITGGASGIGFETAKALSAVGATVTHACGGQKRHVPWRKISGFRQATTPSRSDIWTFRIWFGEKILRRLDGAFADLDQQCRHYGFAGSPTNVRGLGDAVRDELPWSFCFDDGAS